MVSLHTTTQLPLSREKGKRGSETLNHTLSEWASQNSDTGLPTGKHTAFPHLPWPTADLADGWTHPPGILALLTTQ